MLFCPSKFHYVYEIVYGILHNIIHLLEHTINVNTNPDYFVCTYLSCQLLYVYGFTVQRKFVMGENFDELSKSWKLTSKIWWIPKLQNILINAHPRFFWILQDWLHICWVFDRYCKAGNPRLSIVYCRRCEFRHSLSPLWWEGTTCIRVSG